VYVHVVRERSGSSRSRIGQIVILVPLVLVLLLLMVVVGGLLLLVGMDLGRRKIRRQASEEAVLVSGHVHARSRGGRSIRTGVPSIHGRQIGSSRPR